MVTEYFISSGESASIPGNSLFNESVDGFVEMKNRRTIRSEMEIIFTAFFIAFVLYHSPQMELLQKISAGQNPTCLQVLENLYTK